MEKLKFAKIRDVKDPCRAHPTDAGIDFFVPNDFNETEVLPNQSILINGGVKVKIPKGYALIFFNKSGVAAKKHLVLGSCVIDECYEGELIYNLNNIGNTFQVIRPGEKIVQGILLPVNYAEVEMVDSVDELYKDSTSTRGEGGFGSTGN